MRGLLTLLLASFWACGCATKHSVEMARIANEAYGTYIGQARASEMLTITAAPGESISFTVTGAQSLVLKSQNVPLSVLNTQDDTVRNVMEGAARIATVAGAAYVGNNLVGAVKPVSPVIVPAQVVQPQIFPVPTQVIR